MMMFLSNQIVEPPVNMQGLSVSSHTYKVLVKSTEKFVLFRHLPMVLIQQALF